MRPVSGRAVGGRDQAAPGYPFRPSRGPAARRRDAIRTLVLLGAALLTALGGGCGFRPLYGRGPAELPGVEGPPPGQPLRAELSAVRIIGPGGGRLGQIVRNELIDLLNPTGAEVPPVYDLVVRLRRGSQALAVQLDNTVTRYNLVLVANFQLRRIDDGRPVYGSRVRRAASYNVRRQPFATLIAERDAERRAARAVGEEIVTQLAVLLASDRIEGGEGEAGEAV